MLVLLMVLPYIRRRPWRTVRKVVVLGWTVHDETYNKQDRGERSNDDDDDDDIIITAINELIATRTAPR